MSARRGLLPGASLLALATAAPAADFKESSTIFNRPVFFLENGNVRPHGRIFTNVNLHEMPKYGLFAVRNPAGDVVAALVDNHIFLHGGVLQNQSSFPGRLKFRRGDGSVIASFGDNGNLYVDNAVENVASCVAPVWEPTKWNNSMANVFMNNCYNYANNQLTHTFARVGLASGITSVAKTVADVRSAALSDGLTWVGWNFPGNTYTCPNNGTLVYMAVAPNVDYHWYRLDKADGKWSHKIGTLPVSDKDASGNTISNPQAANRNYSSNNNIAANYSDNGGFYCTCGSDANVY